MSSREGQKKSSTASIWNEVFPITLVSKQALLIRVHPEQTLPCIGYLDHPFKNKTVETEKYHLRLFANTGGLV